MRLPKPKEIFLSTADLAKGKTLHEAFTKKTLQAYDKLNKNLKPAKLPHWPDMPSIPKIAGILFGLTKTAAERLKLRPRVDVFIYNNKGEVLAEPSPYRNTLRFPGGGIDEGASINDAAREEALEEAGIEIGKITTVGKPLTLKWTESVKERNRQRGRDFDGNRQYFRAAPLKAKNTDMYGMEGDALRKAMWIPISNAIDFLKEHGEAGEDFSDLSAMEADALKRLKSKLKLK